MTEKMEVVYRIGSIENFYGGLYVGIYKNKHYMFIENYCNSFLEFNEDWEEISEKLFNLMVEEKAEKT